MLGTLQGFVCLHLSGDVARDVSRWDKILQEQDNARVWRAIAWQGKFQDSSVSNATPTDEEFKTFYENVIFPDFD